ncbi:MAG: stage II sporulation protein M [Pirellulales bacterium]
MKVAQLLEVRRQNWQELELLCDQFQRTRRSRQPAAAVTRFTDLYRAACADLALADAYQLPPDTVQYLHQLVGRAHNQLYHSRPFDLKYWGQVLLYEVPQKIFHDRCVHVAFCVFWGVFILSAILAYSRTLWPTYAEEMLGDAMISQLEENFREPLQDRPYSVNVLMAAFYISHNTGIGMKCFTGGLLIVPGMFITLFNAGFLGASFGYMARPDVPEGKNFFEFVTAHGPFELTAIVLSAGAGLRLGVSLLSTRGYARLDSLRRAASDAMPIMGAFVVLFFLAALTEAFISPTSLPYWVKAAVAVIDSGLLTFYFVVLGFPRRPADAAG